MTERITVIQANNPSLKEVIDEFWEYRELLYVFTLKRVKVRYKQTFLGIIWVLIQPLVTMLIFTVIFGRLVKIPTDGIPYFIFVYSGLVLWGLFSEGLNRASASLVGEAQLVSKVYFPRLMIPLSAIASAWVDFAVSLCLLLPMILISGFKPTWSLFLIPLIMLVTMFLATGIGVGLAALSARYRDFQYILPFLLQVLLYASPIVYSVQIVPVHLRFWYYLNPLAGLLDLFRFAVTGQTTFSWLGFAWSSIASVIFFVLGTWLFKTIERGFADYV